MCFHRSQIDIFLHYDLLFKRRERTFFAQTDSCERILALALFDDCYLLLPFVLSHRIGDVIGLIHKIDVLGHLFVANQSGILFFFKAML